MANKLSSVIKAYLKYIQELVKKFIRLFLYFVYPIKKKPDFIIIGVQKGGTSSLFYYLNQHPQLNGSKRKETHFFSKYYYKGFSWYKSFFPYKWDNRMTFEATPYYLFHPAAPDRIRRHLKNIKFIVLLREPIARAYSHYKMEYKWGVEQYSFAEALELEDERLKGEETKLKQNSGYISYNHQSFSYIERSLYYKQLKKWFEMFGKDKFLVLKSEEFFSNPETELNKVYSFLNVKNYKISDLKAINTGEYVVTDVYKHIPQHIIDKVKVDNNKLDNSINISFGNY